MLGLNRGTGVNPIFGSGISSAQFQPPSVRAAAPAGVDFMLLPSTAEDRWVEPPGDADRDGFTDPPKRAQFTGSRKGIYQLPPFSVSGVITEVRAGATRFKFAPEFELGLKITNDKASGLPYDTRDVQAALGVYTSSLGSMYEPPDDGGLNSGDAWDPILDTIDDVVTGIDSFGEWLENLADSATDILPGGD